VVGENASGPKAFTSPASHMRAKIHGLDLSDDRGEILPSRIQAQGGEDGYFRAGNRLYALGIPQGAEVFVIAGNSCTEKGCNGPGKRGPGVKGGPGSPSHLEWRAPSLPGA